MEFDKVYQGDCIEVVAGWPAGCVHCCVTSPPYWALRDYGTEGQIGLEETPEEYIEKMVAVFRHVWRVLRDEGTLWLNMADTYNAGRNGGHAGGRKGSGFQPVDGRYRNGSGVNAPNLKPKDLCGMPWRLALALQADGWYLRQDIIWHKPNPMPESARDRCTKAHEYIFLLTKKPKYYCDMEAITEETRDATPKAKDTGVGFGRIRALAPDDSRRGDMKLRVRHPAGWATGSGSHGTVHSEGRAQTVGNRRNKRSVWTITTKPYSGAHFATFPPDLVEPCIKAGTSEKGCCPACGAPWIRCVAKDRRPTRNVVTSKTEGKEEAEYGNRDPQRHVTETKTVGWRPSCSCWDAEYRKFPRSGKSKRRRYQDVCGTWFERARKRPGLEVWERWRGVVLDPFMGSGTVAEVAYRLNRHYLGCEISGEYMKLIEKRMSEARAEFALLEA